jgi:hypothetical protein
VLTHEAGGRQLEDEPPVHLLVEVEIEGVERLARLAKASRLDAPPEQAGGWPRRRSA